MSRRGETSRPLCLSLKKNLFGSQRRLHPGPFSFGNLVVGGGGVFCRIRCCLLTFIPLLRLGLPPPLLCVFCVLQGPGVAFTSSSAHK